MQAFKCNSVAVELKQHNALEISRKHFGSFGCVQCTEPCTVRRTLEVCSKELADTFVVSEQEAEVVDQVVKEEVDSKEKKKVGKASNNTN